MANDMQAYVGAEFQALPLDFIMAAPLTAAVKAQAAAAEAARGFIEAMLDDNGAPKPAQFQMAVKQNDGASKDVQIIAPLLSLVPVPHLRIDSLTGRGGGGGARGRRGGGAAGAGGGGQGGGGGGGRGGAGGRGAGGGGPEGGGSAQH